MKRLGLALWTPIVACSVACGSPAIDVRTATREAVYGAGVRFDVRTFTDLDDVRDIVEVRDSVVVATDRGLVIHSEAADRPPMRVTARDGLPSDDVRAVAASADGRVFVASGTEIATFMEGRAEMVAQLSASPRIGALHDVLVTHAGSLWACGEGGVVRAQRDELVRVGEPMNCAFLVESVEGHLWAGTDAGLVFIEGDVLREHTTGTTLPRGRARALVPLAGGHAFALFEAVTGSTLGYFDGHRWYVYTLPDLRGRAVALTKHGDDVRLWIDGSVLVIDRGVDGARLVPLWRSPPFSVRSFRARIFPTSHLDAPPAAPEANRMQAPKPLVPAPRASARHIAAPSFSARVSTPSAVPGRVVTVHETTRGTFVAAASQGVLALRDDGSRRAFRTRDLARASRLRLASDAGGRVWLVPSPGELARWESGVVWRARGPEGLRVLAVAEGPRGAYLIGSVEGTATQTLRVYRIGEQRYERLMERTVATPAGLVDIPFAAVDANEVVWLGAGLVTQEGGATRVRTRGALVLDARTDRVVYHHSAAQRSVDGGLRLPDEAYAIDLTVPDTAWFATLSGAVRIARQQAVIFGQARGVPGEIVTDVAVQGSDLVWIAAAEGFGAYAGGRLEFGAPSDDDTLHPIALDIDAQGVMWAASPRALHYATREMAARRAPMRFVRVGGLDTEDFRDVHVDRRGRVWVLGRDRITVMLRTRAHSQR